MTRDYGAHDHLCNRGIEKNPTVNPDEYDASQRPNCSNTMHLFLKSSKDAIHIITCNVQFEITFTKPSNACNYAKKYVIALGVSKITLT